MTLPKLKTIHCLFYVIGQIIESFIGDCAIYLVFHKEFDEYDGDTR